MTCSRSCLLVLVLAACGSADVDGDAGPAADAVTPTWGDDRRLTDAPGDSLTTYNFARDVAVAGDAVHVVWYDERDASSQVYYKRSLDGGDTWQPDVRLVADATPRLHPAIAAAGDAVHVAWYEQIGDQFHVVVARSIDAGATWQSPRRMSTTGAAAQPSLAADGDSVQLVWGDTPSGDTEIVHAHSIDAGASWSEPARLSTSPYASWVGGVTVRGARVVASWVDYRDANEEEYARVSDDGGATWGPLQRLSDDAADSWAPSVAISGDMIHFFWFDRRHTHTDAEVEAPLDAAAALVGITVEPAPPRDPAVYYLPPFMARLAGKRDAIAAAAPAWVQAGGNPDELLALMRQHEARLVAWMGGWELYYRRSDDGGVTWGTETRITTAPNLSMRPSVVAVDDRVDVVWFDGRDGDADDLTATEIYHASSADAGLTWSADRRLTTAAGASQHASVAATADRVHVVWYDERHGDAEVYYKRMVR